MTVLYLTTSTQEGVYLAVLTDEDLDIEHTVREVCSIEGLINAMDAFGAEVIVVDERLKAHTQQHKEIQA